MIDHDELESLKVLIEELAEQEKELYFPAFISDGKKHTDLNAQLDKIKAARRYHTLEVLHVISSKRAFWENILTEGMLEQFENV